MRITPKCVWNISRCLRSSSVYVSGMEANPKCNNSKYTTANPRLLRQRLHSTSSPPYVSGATTHFGFRDIPTTEKEEHVRRVFENVAESYDVMNDVMSAGVHRYWKDEFCRMTCLESITKYLRSQEGSGEFKILDVAGGTGDIAFRLLEAGNCTERAKSSGLDPISVTVCDINPHMLRVGEQRARSMFGSVLLDQSCALSFVEGNAQELQFEEDSFHLYTIAFGLRNVTDVDKALHEAYRVLKPGGRFMCLEFSQIEDYDTLRQLYDWYSFNVIPTLGKLVANDEQSYQYLVESIRKFCSKQELNERLERVGFKLVKHTDMMMGAVTVHEGWKTY